MKQQVAMCPEGHLGILMRVTQIESRFLDADGYEQFDLANETWFSLKFVTSCGMVLWADVGDTLYEDTEILGDL